MHDFGLPDLIRLNQLVRHRIDFAGFQAWYHSLPREQRRHLAYLLCEYAHQAGVSDAIWEEALIASGLGSTDSVVEKVLSSRKGKHPLFGMYELLNRLSDEEIFTVFRLFVYLFGIAEGRVYRGESKDRCNHWWHRDLLDKRVVQDLLADPQFYMTAMRDDDRIKDTTEESIVPDRPSA